jgi:hypothetical protein
MKTSYRSIIRSEKMKKQSVAFFLSILSILTFLSACGADPSKRAGAWEGSTEYGDFTFYITDDGTAIEDVSYLFKCNGIRANDYSFQMGAPYRLDGRRLEFEIAIGGQMSIAKWTAEFSTDGKTLIGELSLLADSCTTDFEITR